MCPLKSSSAGKLLSVLALSGLFGPCTTTLPPTARPAAPIPVVLPKVVIASAAAVTVDAPPTVPVLIDETPVVWFAYGILPIPTLV